MQDDLCWFSLVLWFRAGERSGSNFLASTVRLGDRLLGDIIRRSLCGLHNVLCSRSRVGVGKDEGWYKVGVYGLAEVLAWGRVKVGLSARLKALFRV